MSILWGYAEVTPAKVTVMAEIAEKAEDIDVGRAQQAVERPNSDSRQEASLQRSKKRRSVSKKARLRKKIADRARKAATRKGRSLDLPSVDFFAPVHSAPVCSTPISSTPALDSSFFSGLGVPRLQYRLDRFRLRRHGS